MVDGRESHEQNTLSDSANAGGALVERMNFIFVGLILKHPHAVIGKIPPRPKFPEGHREIFVEKGYVLTEIVH